MLSNIQKTNQTKANFYALGTVLLWSTVSTAFKLALAKASALLILSYAMLIASGILLFYIFINKELALLFKLSKKQFFSCFLLCSILFIYYQSLFIGYAGLPVQIAQPVNYSWTLMLALISSFIFKQKLSGKEIFWILFAYAGVLIISLGNSSTIMQANSLSLFCILISTILYAVYWIYNTAVKLPANIKLFLGFLGASLLGFITLFFRNEPFVLPQDAIPPTCYIGLIELSIPFILWDRALQYTKSISKIATIPLISPFFALLWANSILNEHINPLSIIGLLFIVGGIFMQQKNQKQP